MSKTVRFRKEAGETLGVTIGPGRLVIESASRDELHEVRGLVITSMNNEPCSTKEELKSILDKYPEGEITVTVEKEDIKTMTVPVGEDFDVYQTPPLVTTYSPGLDCLKHQLILKVNNRECTSKQSVEKIKSQCEGKSYTVTYVKAPVGYIERIEQSVPSSGTISFTKLLTDISLGVKLDEKTLIIQDATRREFVPIIGKQITHIDGVSCDNLHQLGIAISPIGTHVVSYREVKTNSSPVSDVIGSLSPNNGTEPHSPESGTIQFERLPGELNLGVTLSPDTLIVQRATREAFLSIIGKQITHVDNVLVRNIKNITPLITSNGKHVVRFREAKIESEEGNEIIISFNRTSIEEPFGVLLSDNLIITQSNREEFSKHVGSQITHINGTQVLTLNDIRNTVPSSGNVAVTMKTIKRSGGGEVTIIRKEREPFGATVSADLVVTKSSRSDVQCLVGKRITKVNRKSCTTMKELVPLLTNSTGSPMRIEYEDGAFHTTKPTIQQRVREQQEIAHMLSKVHPKNSSSQSSLNSLRSWTLIYNQQQSGALVNNVTLSSTGLEVVDVQEPALYPLVGTTIKRINNISVTSAADLERLAADRYSINVTYIKTRSSQDHSPRTSQSQSNSSNSSINSSATRATLLPIPPSVGAPDPIVRKKSVFSFRCSFQDFTRPHLYKKGLFRGDEKSGL